MSAFDELIGETDAQKWAKEFVKVAELRPDIPRDEGTMIGWFANAIMAGYDEGLRIERRRGVVDIVREIAYLSAGAGSDAVMAEAPDVVMPSEDITERVEHILRQYGIDPERRCDDADNSFGSSRTGTTSFPPHTSSKPPDRPKNLRGSAVEQQARPDGLLRELRPMESE